MTDEERLPPLEDLPPADPIYESRYPNAAEDDVYAPAEPPVPPEQNLADDGVSGGDPAMLPSRREIERDNQSTVKVPVGYSTPPTPRAVRWVWYIFWMVEILLVIRIFLKLLAANPLALFSSLIYGITWPFVALFYGVFPSPTGSGHQLDAASILALLIYPLIAWAITEVIYLRRRRSSTV
jgi:hypothetical protein